MLTNPPNSYLYHLALSKDWQAAKVAGLYTVGSLHRSFEQDGFIHLAYVTQVNVIADLIYRDTPDVLLLTIGPTRLVAEVKEGLADYPPELFPHLFGPLNIEDVANVEQYVIGDDSKFPALQM